MRFSRTSICATIALAMAFCWGRQTADAALPPMSEEELRSQADTIVVGKVLGIRTRVTSEGDFSDEELYLDVSVTTVEKGSVTVGQTITGKTWRPKERPDGFVGHQGQNEIPKQGDDVELYCKGTVNFQFRRGGKGLETAHLILEPNGIHVHGEIPDGFVGEWESRWKQDFERTITTTLSLYADGHYHEANRVDRVVDGRPTATSSISHGEARVIDGVVHLAEDTPLMLLRDGRLLLENEWGAKVFRRKTGAPVIAPDPTKPNPTNPKPDNPPQKPTPSEKALRFAKFAGMTIELLPNGDLKVVAVEPGGGASRKGIRAGQIIFKWDFQEQPGGGGGWSASFRDP